MIKAMMSLGNPIMLGVVVPKFNNSNNEHIHNAIGHNVPWDRHLKKIFLKESMW